MKQIYNCCLEALENHESILKQQILKGGPSIKSFKVLLERVEHEIETLKEMMKDVEI